MEHDNHGPRGRLAALPRNRVFAVSVGTFLVMACEGVVSPILPLYAQDLGATVGIVGLVVGSAGLARLIFNFPAGSVSDAIGRRPFLIAGPLITATGAVLAGFAGSVWQLVAYRFLAGMGNGLFMTGRSSSSATSRTIGGGSERSACIAPR
jgi:MFS family permease